MPLPIFPTELGAPGDGDLIAIHGGAPASTEVFGGLIESAQAVEAYTSLGVTPPLPDGREGDPLTVKGVSIWIRGSLLLDINGDPTVSDYADMLARWSALRNKMLESDYELFLYYHPGAPATFRKYKAVNSIFVRGFWNNPVSMSYLLGAVSLDETLYETAPGL